MAYFKAILSRESPFKNKIELSGNSLKTQTIWHAILDHIK